MIYLKIYSSILAFGTIFEMKKEDNSSCMLQLFFFYFTFAPLKTKSIELNYRHRKYDSESCPLQ